MTSYETINQEVNHGLTTALSNLKFSSDFAKKCGKPTCRYCDALGEAKRTFVLTKPMFVEMLAKLQNNQSPKVIFDKHIRTEYGNYQAWILPHGHYVNVWKVGGHSLFKRVCEEQQGIYLRGDVNPSIKVHAQGKRSDIIIFSRTKPPTPEQMETIYNLLTDSIMWNYKITFSFSYDAHHPDPKFLEELPF